MTKRQERIFFYIKKYIEENHYAPSYRDICRALDIPSTSTVHADVHQLILDGYLSMDKGNYRSLKVIFPPEREEDPSFAEAKKPMQRGQAAGQNRIDRSEEIFDIPIYGDVAAGEPIYADDYVEDRVFLPSSFFPSGNDRYFILKVHGESMIEAGILDGDKLICKKPDTAQNSEQVVALIEDSATVKTFFQRKGYVELRPENSSMEPIIVKECQILGIVLGLYRLYRR